VTGLGDFLGSLQKYLHCPSTKPELVCSIKCVSSTAPSRVCGEEKSPCTLLFFRF
jgi:hypothetical protein